MVVTDEKRKAFLHRSSNFRIWNPIHNSRNNYYCIRRLVMIEAVEELRRKLDSIVGNQSKENARDRGVPFYLGSREPKKSLFIECRHLTQQSKRGSKTSWFCKFPTHIDDFIYGKDYDDPNGGGRRLTTKGSELFSCDGCHQKLLQKLQKFH